MKTFKPYNRHILIEMPKKETTEESSILLPEDYKVDQSECVVVNVLDNAFDCDLRWSTEKNSKAVVERNMIREIKVEDKTYLIILENYVVGVISNE